jgi:hypothetical protein
MALDNGQVIEKNDLDYRLITNQEREQKNREVCSTPKWCSSHISIAMKENEESEDRSFSLLQTRRVIRRRRSEQSDDCHASGRLLRCCDKRSPCSTATRINSIHCGQSISLGYGESERSGKKKRSDVQQCSLRLESVRTADWTACQFNEYGHRLANDRLSRWMETDHRHPGVYTSDDLFGHSSKTDTFQYEEKVRRTIVVGERYDGERDDREEENFRPSIR